MKNIYYILFFLLQILFKNGNSQELNLRYEFLLNKQMINDSLNLEYLVNHMEVSPQNYITFCNGQQIYSLGWGGITTIGNKSNSIIHSFTYTSDGLLLSIHNKSLCSIDKQGNWKNLMELPNTNMKINSGRDVVYIYNHGLGLEKYNLFALAKNGKYKQLISSPKSINAVCEWGDSIFIAIESGIYSYSPISEKLTPLFGLDNKNSITSLTIDQKNGIFYFTSINEIYALKNSTLIKLSNEFPNSIVKYFGNGLLIFNPQSQNIIRIVNIEESLLF